MKMPKLVPVPFLVLATLLQANIENWPGWRGPRGDGSSLAPKVPVKWTLEENLVWKEKVIINGDHDGDAYLVALDRKTGKQIWKTDRPNKVPEETNASPAIYKGQLFIRSDKHLYCIGI